MSEHRRERPDIRVYFDGDCPLCRREIALLRRLDRRSRIQYTDIASPDFDPDLYDRDLPTLMGRLHGQILQDDSWVWIEGVEVFRQIYARVGMGGLVSLSRIGPISAALDRLYVLFADNRLRWTQRFRRDACSNRP